MTYKVKTSYINKIIS